MPDNSDPPILGLTGPEPAAMLGVSIQTVTRLTRSGQLPRIRYQHGGLDRVDVEQVALERYRPGHPYWATTGEAAEVLGVTRERVRQLVVAGLVPAVVHAGRRYFRRHQVEVTVNVRHSRSARWRP